MSARCCRCLVPLPEYRGMGRPAKFCPACRAEEIREKDRRRKNAKKRP